MPGAQHYGAVMKIPRQHGYRMPAEWEMHETTWISWPKDPDTFPPNIIDNVENIYCQMIGALQQGEKVNILVNDAGWEERARKKLEARGLGLKNIIFHHIKSVDVWTRDYAPIFVKDKKGKVAATKWIFNAWGEKWEPLLSDDKAGEEIAKATKMEIFRPHMVLEGGSIDVNGKGMLLTTEQCLLNKNRNPKLKRKQIERYLTDYLGVDSIIWLKEGIAGDDTDGHVDDITRFVNDNTVITMVEEDKNDANYKPLRENLEVLKKTGFDIIELPMPGKIEIPERRLPASYANFYIGNSVVLLPVFKDAKDRDAVGILEDLFPKRKVVPIYAYDLVYGHGAIHCMTMQQPC